MQPLGLSVLLLALGAAAFSPCATRCAAPARDGRPRSPRALVRVAHSPPNRGAAAAARPAGPARTWTARIATVSALMIGAVGYVARQNAVRCASAAQVVSAAMLVLLAAERGRAPLAANLQALLSPLRDMAEHLTERQDAETASTETAAADRITLVGAAVNVVLSIAKLAAGIIGHSSAMVSDAVHSMSDLVSDGVTLGAMRVARLPADAQHPYGHGRFEQVGALGVALLLVGAGTGVANHALDMLWQLYTGKWTAHKPGAVALIAALVSVVSKELLFRSTMGVARHVDSPVLAANAWHHRSDALSSVVAVIGIGGARCGYAVLDPAAAAVVAAMLTMTGLQMASEALAELTDTIDESDLERAVRRAERVPGVVAVESARARYIAGALSVDLTVRADATSMSSCAQVSELVRMAILRPPFRGGGDERRVAEVQVRVLPDAEPSALAAPPQEDDVARDVRESLQSLAFDDDAAVRHVVVHHDADAPSVDVFLTAKPGRSVPQLAVAAARIRDRVEALPKVAKAQIHFSLTDTE
ncbi:cation efflux family-domain-containing protein [Pelagophyceae sp. CCMP2097]|nr:cation efflux family-domain-containing protein [Pelagophyceae sp. CCMP2097]